MIYVLMGSSGDWDSYTKFILGVYDSKELAESEGRLYDVSLQKDKYSEDEVDVFRERIRDIDTEHWNQDPNSDTYPSYPQDIEEYLDWKMEFRDLDNSWIEEYELNQRHATR